MRSFIFLLTMLSSLNIFASTNFMQIKNNKIKIDGILTLALSLLATSATGFASSRGKGGKVTSQEQIALFKKGGSTKSQDQIA